MKKIVTTVWNELWGNPIINAKAALKKAIEAQARSSAEISYHQELEEFFSKQAASIDHTVDWWDYANAKEAEKENQIEKLREAKLSTKLSAKTQACVNKLAKLKES